MEEVEENERVVGREEGKEEGGRGAGQQLGRQPQGARVLCGTRMWGVL